MVEGEDSDNEDPRLGGRSLKDVSDPQAKKEKKTALDSTIKEVEESSGDEEEEEKKEHV